MNKVTVQKVSGLIKRSPVSFVSHKLPYSSKEVRTTGLYARKGWDGQTVVGFATWGYAHLVERAVPEMQKFFKFAEAEGYSVKPYEWNEYVIERAS